MASRTSPSGTGPSRPGYRPTQPGYLDALLGAGTGESERAGARRVRAPHRPAWRPDVEPLPGQDYWPGRPAGESDTRGRTVSAATSPGTTQPDQHQGTASHLPEISQSTASASQAPTGERVGPPGQRPPAPAAPAPPRSAAGPPVGVHLSRPAPGRQPGASLAGPPDQARPPDRDISITSRSGPAARPEGPAGPPPTTKAGTSPAWRLRIAGDVDAEPARRPAPTPARAVLPERPAAATALPAAALPAAGSAIAGSPTASVPSVHIGVVEVRVLTPAPPPPAAPRPRTAAQAGRGPGGPVRFFGLAQG